MHDHSLVSDYIFDELSFVSKFTFSDPDDYHSSISEKYLEYDCCCSCYDELAMSLRFGRGFKASTTSLIKGRAFGSLLRQ